MLAHSNYNLKDHVLVIIDQFLSYHDGMTQYSIPIQVITMQLFKEQEDAHVEYTQRSNCKLPTITAAKSPDYK